MPSRNQAKNIFSNSKIERLVNELNTKEFTLGRIKQDTCFERIQIYLHPEVVSKLRSEAQNKHIKISRYIRDLLSQPLITFPKGTKLHE